jgi:hypothetical protein
MIQTQSRREMANGSIVEDDTANIRCRIDRHGYITLGLPLVEDAKIGDWYIWKGIVNKGFRSVNVKRWRKLTDNPKFAKPVVI